MLTISKSALNTEMRKVYDISSFTFSAVVQFMSFPDVAAYDINEELTVRAPNFPHDHSFHPLRRQSEFLRENCVFRNIPRQLINCNIHVDPSGIIRLSRIFISRYSNNSRLRKRSIRAVIDTPIVLAIRFASIRSS